MYDAIRVGHWYHNDLIVVYQERGYWILLDDILNDAFCDEGAHCFAGMLPCKNKYDFISVSVWFIKEKRRDDVVGYRISDGLDFHLSE
jgi:hypothetical protein